MTALAWDEGCEWLGGDPKTTMLSNVFERPRRIEVRSARPTGRRDFLEKPSEGCLFSMAPYGSKCVEAAGCGKRTWFWMRGLKLLPQGLKPGSFYRLYRRD